MQIFFFNSFFDIQWYKDQFCLSLVIEFLREQYAHAHIVPALRHFELISVNHDLLVVILEHRVCSYR